MKTKKPGKDGLPRPIHEVANKSTPTSERTVDMTLEDEEGAVNSEDEAGDATMLSGSTDAS